MAAESKKPSTVHLWDICPGEICTGDSSFVADEFDEEFKSKYDPHEYSAWSWQSEPDEYDIEYFDEIELPDHGKDYGILNLLDCNGYVECVPVLPSQEQEVAEWLRPKFPYPASVVCPLREAAPKSV